MLPSTYEKHCRIAISAWNRYMCEVRRLMYAQEDALYAVNVIVADTAIRLVEAELHLGVDDTTLRGRIPQDIINHLPTFYKISSYKGGICGNTIDSLSSSLYEFMKDLNICEVEPPVKVNAREFLLK